MKEMPGDNIILHKNRKLKKWKKPLGDIIILHMCTKNYDQIIYDSWYRVHNGQNNRWKKWHIEVGCPA